MGDNMMKYDLHVHSKYSYNDGILEPKDIINIAMKKGLSGIAITDHDTIEGGLRAKKYLNKINESDIELIIGCELSTTNGHVIGLFLTEEIQLKDVHTPITADYAIDEIHSQGGIVVIPHPFDRFRKPFKNLINYICKIDAIEGFNSRCIFHSYNKLAIDFAQKYNIRIVAGSDAHHGNEIGLAGIYVERNIKEEIMSNNLKTFYDKSSIFNRIRTRCSRLGI